jgi:acylphosphatase
MRAVRATVSGFVHGVGFRWTAARRAERSGVAGWVRNEPDGTVRVWAQGEEEAVAAFLDFLRMGPPGARVAAVEVEEAEPDETLRGFAIAQGRG